MRHTLPGQDDLIRIGTIKKVHGIKGEVVFLCDGALPEKILTTEQIFLLIEGCFVPFFLSHCEARGENLFVLHFDTISSRNEAEELTGCDVYIYPERKKKKKKPASLSGYAIVDVNTGPVGTLTGILEYPGQHLFKVKGASKEFLIPVHENLIMDIDDKAKQIVVKLPEGLLDL